jgi:pimeloyl-ACP methyl ester carboxylesterase
VHLPVDAVRTDGNGPHIVFIHGTGRTGAEIPFALLCERVRATSYDRRGTPRWPLASDFGLPSVADHAADAVEIIESFAADPVHVCGLSFGGAVALEVMRYRPDLVRSAVLFEPAVPASDDEMPPACGLLDIFQRFVDCDNGEAAAELFCRRTLSAGEWERLAPNARASIRSMWRHIYCDLKASAAYRVRYDDLAGITQPVLLLRGERSPLRIQAPIGALERRLPNSRTAVVARAGHAIGVQAWRDFSTTLFDFVGA